MFEHVLSRPGFWAIDGPCNDVVLSSRIRLARNLKSLPFPNKLEEGELFLLTSLIDKFVSESSFSEHILFIDLNKIDSNEKRILRERNIITYEMEISNNSHVLIDSEEDFTILINDEDHFRIQVIKSGFQILDAYRLAEKVDNELNKYMTYAFSDEYGYLSACPSNLGTGMRASVLLHLPVLSMKKKINDIVSRARKNGIEVKGTIGDSYKTLGNIYQISNKVTLGLSEVDLIENLDLMVNGIIEMEDHERDEYFTSSKPELEDKIWRSYGVMKHARKISYVEAMDHLSNIRLGVIFAVIKNIDIHIINNLMVNIQWSHLQRNFGKVFKSTVEGDQSRAEYIRMNLD